MKFFTMAWWGGAQRPTAPLQQVTDAYAAYATHLAAIQAWLPSSLVTLDAQVPLHDARLRTLTYTTDTQTLTIGLDNTFDAGDVRRFYLCYLGVIAFHSVADPDVGLPGPYGYGDLGYDELDLTPTRHAIHRLLFSSGIELHITCTDFRLTWTDPRTA